MLQQHENHDNLSRTFADKPLALISLREISVAFGGPLILDHIDLAIESGERICLIGRNGMGKSTLLSVLNGDIEPDHGHRHIQAGIRTALLDQNIPGHIEGTIYDAVASGLGKTGDLIKEYHSISIQISGNNNPDLLNHLEHIQKQLEAGDGWNHQQRVDTVLSRLQLPPEQIYDQLSGGLKRRVLLARALVSEPDILLLDEPTNHLDIESVQWLEEFLLTMKITILFISHDRAFLNKLATRIILLDRGKISSYPGDYVRYLKRRQAELETESDHQKKFDKKLAQEETWIRQGIKARRTRNEGRVRTLEKLRANRKERRELSGRARISVEDTRLSGKLVAELDDVYFSFDNKPCISGFSTTILRGDKIGIIGPNGCGKSTLLGLLLGRLEPQSGTIKLGTSLKIAYFDQQRMQLNEEKSALENISEGREYITINNKEKHIISYLQDFMFTPERSCTPIRTFSGGERNRLLLAMIFSKPSNVLVLDEPTNDLDIETLELLEELCLDYSGTLIVVSHDRTFVNNIVTSTLVFEGNGKVSEFVGNYDDWIHQKSITQPEKSSKSSRSRSRPKIRKQRPKKTLANKPSYKEKLELESLPGYIEQLENKQQELLQKMADPGFYKAETENIKASNDQLNELEAALSLAYRRWEELENRQ